MAKTKHKQQKAVARKKAKQRQHSQQLRSHVSSSPIRVRSSFLKEAASWPVYECLAPRDWQEPGQLLQVSVARKSATGEVVAGVFLVDLGCLGTKNAFTRRFSSESAYRFELRSHLMQSQAMTKIDFNLAAKIIAEANRYAADLGFQPHRDYANASILLDGADLAAAQEIVPLGQDGKPFYVSGPHDNADRIIATLQSSVGTGNFDYLVEIHPESGFLRSFDDEDEDDDAGDEDEEDEEEAGELENTGRTSNGTLFRWPFRRT